MEPMWSKLDKGLKAIYANFLTIRESKDLTNIYVHESLKNSKNIVHVTVVYTGDIENINENSFTLQSIEKEGVANGLLNLEKLAELSNNDQVTKILHGNQYYPLL